MVKIIKRTKTKAERLANLYRGKGERVRVLKVSKGSYGVFKDGGRARKIAKRLM